MTLSQHSLFKQKAVIASKKDLLHLKLNNHGDKIILDIPLSHIDSLPQVRRLFEKEKIKQLAEDIQKNGLIHPISVMRHAKEESKFVLLIGGNRFLAARYLHWETIPCIVKPYNANTAENHLLQLSENLQRHDLNPIELAEAIMDIKRQSGYTLAKIAKSIGRTIDSIKQYSRISKLTDTEKKYHIEQKSTKNEILNYLAKRDTKSLCKKEEIAESLFDTKKAHPYAHLSKKEITEKLIEAKAFIKIAQKILQSES